MRKPSSFCVSFFCQIDGPIHKQQQHYDQARTEQLEAFGYRVLRLTNQQVLDDLTTALTLIKTAIKTLSPPEYALRAAARGGGWGALRVLHPNEILYIKEPIPFQVPQNWGI